MGHMQRLWCNTFDVIWFDDIFTSFSTKCFNVKYVDSRLTVSGTLA